VLRKLSWSLLTVAYACSFSAVALAQVTAQPSTNLPSHMPTEMNRPVSINGEVVFDNGAPMTASVAILRVCGSMVHREAVTNARGTFNFILSETMDPLDIEYDVDQLLKEGGFAPQKIIGIPEGEKIKPLRGLEESLKAGRALTRGNAPQASPRRGP